MVLQTGRRQAAGLLLGVVKTAVPAQLSARGQVGRVD